MDRCVPEVPEFVSKRDKVQGPVSYMQRKRRPAPGKEKNIDKQDEIKKGYYFKGSFQKGNNFRQDTSQIVCRLDAFELVY